MTIRVFEAFSGVGSQRMALRNLGIDHEVVAISDVDEFTVKSYASIHDNDKTVSQATNEDMQDYLEKRNIPLNDKGVRKILKGKKLKEFYEACIKSNNLGDISKIETQDIPDHDLFTYSFPCFTGDTLVLTNAGYKRINEIEIGDTVLTHTNQYKKVTNVFNQGVKDIVSLKGMAFHNIKTTETHKFLTRERYRTWNNERRSYDRLFHEPQWVEVKDLTKDHYLGLSINQKSELPVWDGYSNSWNTGYGDRTYDTNLITPLLENNNFWWLIGRYVADGWTRSQGGIIIAVPDVKLEELESKVDGLFKYNISKEGSVNKVHISVKELELFVKQFGYYAHGKKVSPEVLSLPVELLKSFIEGYFSGDGSYIESKKLYKCTSVSEELIYGIGQCVAKVYRRPYSIYKDIRPETHFIEGRVVNQRDTYSLTFKLETGKQDQAFYEDGHIWFPFNGLEFDGQETVYDIEVEDDHSFTVFNTIVHNCQDISVAGKGLGLNEGSDTRSGLLWECQKVIDGKRPKYLLLENVKNLVGKKHKHNFDKWLEWLEEQGYTNYWQVLNAKDYGVPQNRERVFVVSILGEHEPYEFPEATQLDKTMTSILESEVDEKFYLTDRNLATLTKENTGKYPRKKRFLDNIAIGNNIARTITTRQRMAPEDNYVITNPMGDTAREKRLRQITPLECWRLMGFSDEDFYKAESVNSNTQLYKQAGNSIVVDVLEGIFKQLFEK